ncbi:hypothetical protein BFJ63_vAg17551 [Fusarium oxysporum f. sp. narcissi]|uniref:Uncharacterized protein n=1 Tax=Fusarium oxysporum f. sp. narcissi TaxID=451672 RepID=A0A4Q2UZJ5_FUSOX|nr:hypothetical protein BFJ63_vAg17551 [Fusarium oxysporum f. sp. narcissi]
MGNNSTKQKYDPQPSLLGNLDLCDDERLVATFRFEPCYWEKDIFSSHSFPVGIGSVGGIGHLTDMRLVLFWDVQNALLKEAGEQTSEFIGTALDRPHHEILGRALSIVTKLSSRSRELMQKNARLFPPGGVATWIFPISIDGVDESHFGTTPSEDDECLGRTKNGVYFPVRGCTGGPIQQMTFRPDFIDLGWNNDGRAEEFEEVLNSKIGIKSQRIDRVKFTPHEFTPAAEEYIRNSN